MIKKLFLPAILSLLLMMSPPLFASGAYVPSSSANMNGMDYNKGKAIFNGRIKLEGVSACRDCHASEHRFQRGRLIEIKSKIAEKIINCEIHQSCYQSVITEQQVEQLVNYIIKRYRLD